MFLDDSLKSFSAWNQNHLRALLVLESAVVKLSRRRPFAAV
jgi:hypothetical protein